jgi:cytochrome c oxidase subunit 4
MNDAQASTRKHKPHILPIRTYGTVFVALLILTWLTVRVSYMDFGIFNLLVGIGIASIKATLVVFFFMHLKYDEKFNAILFFGSLAFLGVFFVLTLADTTERGRVDPLEMHQIEPVPGRPELMESHGPEGGTPGAADDAQGGEEAATDDALHDGGAAPEGEATTPEDDAGGH